MDSPSTWIKIPFSTYFWILVTVAFVQIFGIILPLVLPLIIAALIAVAFVPVLRWLERRKWPSWLALTAITASMGLFVLLILAFVVPSVYNETASFVANLPQLRQDLLSKIDSANPIHSFVDHNLNADILKPKAENIKQILGAGNLVLSGFGEFFLIFVFAIYLISDGPRMIEWLTVFFKPQTQEKIRQTLSEVSKIIFSYVVGQFITSALSFIFVLVALSVLKVPGTLLLATLAGILDVLPVLGFVLAVVPAMLFAFNISPQTSAIVLGLYILYHALENYLIVPLVYGNRMRVSGFVVFFTLVAAGLVGGIEGAIVILPIVASYPIIEKIWLSHYIRKETLVDHQGDVTK